MSPSLRRTLFIMFTAAVAVYAVVHLSGPDGISALMAKREAIKQLNETNRKLEDEIAVKVKYNDDIRKRKPEVVLPLIRKRTNKVRPGERDFRFGRSTTPAAPADPPAPPSEN